MEMTDVGIWQSLAPHTLELLRAVAGEHDLPAHIIIHAAHAAILTSRAGLLEHRTAQSYIEPAVTMLERLSDTPEKAEAYAELGRRNMLSTHGDAAVAAAGAAARIAERLGLLEVIAEARITIGCALYEAGEPGALDQLRATVELCRRERLLALPRAVKNLSWALREEGEWTASEMLRDEHPTGYNRTDDNDRIGMRAYYGGDWATVCEAADRTVALPAGQWDIHASGISTWLRLLSAHPPVFAGPDEIDAFLLIGRRSGVYRQEWCALAHGALCRALQRRCDEATELLRELAESWHKVRAIASGEWIAAAAHATALAGRDAPTLLVRMLADVPHRTPWTEAAMRTVTGAAATAEGNAPRAVKMHLAAANIYASMPNLTDQALAHAVALRASAQGGIRSTTMPIEVQLRTFAERNRAVSLLRLAVIDPLS
jgi:hypothetical protein